MKAETVLRNNHIIKVKNCLCPDNVRRVADITGYPDTWFSIPARVRVRGVSVSGFITGFDEGDIRFIPYSYRKNHAMFEGV